MIRYFSGPPGVIYATVGNSPTVNILTPLQLIRGLAKRGARS